MTTKLFGEYLVEKGHVKKTDLLSALIEQLKTTPSALQVAFEKNLMDHDTLLKILLVQHHQRLNFSDAAKSLNCWSTQIQQEVDKHILNAKVPLGEILVKSGVVSLEVVADALDNFLTETKFVPEQKKKEEMANLVTSTSAAAQTVENTSQGALSSSVNPSNPSEGFSTYLEQMTLETYLELKILLSITSDLTLASKYVTKSIDMLQVLKGAARFVKLTFSEQIIKGMLSALEKIVGKDPMSVPKEELQNIENFELNALEILSQLRDEVEAGKSEETVVMEKKLKDQIEKIQSGAI